MITGEQRIHLLLPASHCKISQGLEGPLVVVTHGNALAAHGQLAAPGSSAVQAIVMMCTWVDR